MNWTSLNCAALHCNTLKCTELRCAELQCTTLHCSALNCTALCYEKYWLLLISSICCCAPPSTMRAYKCAQIEYAPVISRWSVGKIVFLPILNVCTLQALHNSEGVFYQVMLFTKIVGIRYRIWYATPTNPFILSQQLQLYRPRLTQIRPFWGKATTKFKSADPTQFWRYNQNNNCFETAIP